jgi:protein-disulfide isomerase
MTALFVAPVAGAAEIKYPELESFARKALTLCPGESRIVIEPVDQAGPSNFKAYRVTMSSTSIEECREVAFALVSQKTSNVLIAAVFVLAADERPPAEKIRQRAEQSLQRQYEIGIADKANADGLRTVTLTNRTPDGPIVTTGYLDGSERFFMVGRLMDMKKDPRTQYLQALGAVSGARRGSLTSRVQVLEISDFQCPSCQEAHKQFEPFFARYRDKIGYTRIDLPFFEYHDWTLRASLGARALQKLRPELYWDYVDFIFQNQAEITSTTIDARIEGFLLDRDVDVAPIRQFMNRSDEKRALVDQVGRLYSEEIYATPTLLVNGQKVYWDRESTFVFDYIESLLKKGTGGSK